MGVGLCILEINWFIELYEFGQIVNFIRKHNKNCQILFGGLYAQISYKRIFKEMDVDYFIKGFSEKPMQMFLDGDEPCSIPNMVGRDFENEVTYTFKLDDYKNTQYNLDWFPDYFKYWSLFPEPDLDMDMDFSNMPLYPPYHYPKKMKDPAKAFRVPPRGGRYHLPMLITSRGHCSSVHEGCESCMGSKTKVLKEVYNSDCVVMDNDTLKQELHKISEKFEFGSLYINSKCNYDLTGEHFPIELTVEFDCEVSPIQLSKIIHSFRKVNVHLVLYKKGHQLGHNDKIHRQVKDFLAMENDHCKIYFFAFKRDADRAGLPQKNRMYADFIFPKWAAWEFYTNYQNAYKFSKNWFYFTRQYNLFPPPKRLIMWAVVYLSFILTTIGSKLGLKTKKDDMIFGKQLSKISSNN